MSSFPALPAKNLPLPLSVAQLLRDLIQERLGIYFDDSRFDALAEKLQPRAQATSCGSFLDYFYLLKYDPNSAQEWVRLMDVFSVQETYFWREWDQVRMWVDHFVPAWFKTHSQPLRVWSAACATGEEPYSLALALEEAGWGQHPIEILASDASNSALEKARLAVYRERSFRALSPALRAKYFRPVADGWALDPAIRRRVNFAWCNLMAVPDFQALGLVSTIFCRNVFIYFAPATISLVVKEFAQHLPPGGQLFVGASESLLRLSTQYELEEISGAFVYQRKSIL